MCILFARLIDPFKARNNFNIFTLYLDKRSEVVDIRSAESSVMYMIDSTPCCHNFVLSFPIMPFELQYKVNYDDAYMTSPSLFYHGSKQGSPRNNEHKKVKE